MRRELAEITCQPSREGAESLSSSEAPFGVRGKGPARPTGSGPGDGRRGHPRGEVGTGPGEGIASASFAE